MSKKKAPQDKKYADYLDEEKAAALAKLDLNRGNIHRTAVETGIPVNTLRSWAKGKHIKPPVEIIRQKKRQDLATRYDNLSHLAIDRIEATIGTADIAMAKDIAGFATTTKQLLIGQPTERKEQGTPGDYQGKLDELRAKRAQRKVS